jgi:N-acyl-D-aspartate/D-glutamate deacylase
MVRTLEHVEAMSPEALRAGVRWEFETFAEYLAAVERQGTMLNYGAFVGHTPVRLYVMGDDGYDREATPDEIAAMGRVVAESVTAGAMGFATSSAPTHNGAEGRPVPSRLATRRRRRRWPRRWRRPAGACSRPFRARSCSSPMRTRSRPRSGGR